MVSINTVDQSSQHQNVPICGASDSLTQGVDGEIHQLLHRLTNPTCRQTQAPRRELLFIFQSQFFLCDLLLYLHLWTQHRQFRKMHFVVWCDLTEGNGRTIRWLSIHLLHSCGEPVHKRNLMDDNFREFRVAGIKMYGRFKAKNA